MSEVLPFKSSIPNIEALWDASVQARIKRYPQNNLRASSVGWPCDRYHFHAIKNWQDVPEHDVGLQRIFDEGDIQERAVIAKLNTLPGIRVIKEQVAFQLDKPLITGSIDGILTWDGYEFPFDVKSMSPFQFPKIRSAEDLLNSPSPLFRKWAVQLQVYLLIAGYEMGAFVLKNKSTGEIRSIWMQIDLVFLETVLKRAERVYAAIAAETPPERTKDIELCLDCPYRHVCLPDLAFGDGVQILGGQELTAMLERRDELKPSVDEYKEIDDAVKKIAVQTGEGEKVCGEFLIKVMKRTRKEYTVKAGEYLEARIVRLTPAKETADGS